MVVDTGGETEHALIILSCNDIIQNLFCVYQQLVSKLTGRPESSLHLSRHM